MGFGQDVGGTPTGIIQDFVCVKRNPVRVVAK
jgi:hypothetical protein